MTPKEKAEEIFTHYHNLIQDLGGKLGQEILVSILARQCSLYAVRITIKETLEVTRKNHSNNFIYTYWLRVEEELIKM